jgi:hypothetical protein
MMVEYAPHYPEPQRPDIYAWLFACACGIVTGIALAVFGYAIALAITPKSSFVVEKETPTVSEKPFTNADGFTVMGDVVGEVPFSAVQHLATAEHRMLSETATGNDLGGDSHVSPNTTIHWRPASVVDSDGTTVEAVLQATAVRLSHLQKSPQAQDKNARALWHVMKALAEFQK